MKKNSLLKVLCLVLVCLMLVPMAIACSKGKKDGADDTNTSTDGGNNGGNNGGSNGGTVNNGKVTIEYDPGLGMLQDHEWEVEIDAGSRHSSHPTPTHSNPAMVFEGWYFDEACTEAVKTAHKYNANTVLYAKWTQMFQCADGSYNHAWGAYYTDSDPTCTKPAITARDCTICGNTHKSEDAANNPALGHDFGKAVEAGFANMKECRRTGCGERVYTDFTNITSQALGNDPASTVQLTEGSGTIYGEDRVSCIVNGAWDEQNAGTFAGKGGQIVVTITLNTPSQMDRIYMKGRGASSFDILVQYQGDSEFVRVGGGSFLSDTENSKDEDERKIPFVEVDNSKIVEKVQVRMPTPSNGGDYWEEIGFFRLPVSDEE